MFQYSIIQTHLRASSATPRPSGQCPPRSGGVIHLLLSAPLPGCLPGALPCSDPKPSRPHLSVHTLPLWPGDTRRSTPKRNCIEALSGLCGRASASSDTLSSIQDLSIPPLDRPSTAHVHTEAPEGGQTPGPGGRLRLPPPHPAARDAAQGDLMGKRRPRARGMAVSWAASPPKARTHTATFPLPPLRAQGFRGAQTRVRAPLYQTQAFHSDERCGLGSCVPLIFRRDSLYVRNSSECGPDKLNTKSPGAKDSIPENAARQGLDGS